MLTWPDGMPNTRMRSRGGLIEYCIARVSSDPLMFRWARERSPWSDVAYSDLAAAKAAALEDYFEAVSMEAEAFRAHGRDI